MKYTEEDLRKAFQAGKERGAFMGTALYTRDEDEYINSLNMVVEGYFIEFDGEFYQSVFPENEAHKSSTHSDLPDAVNYMVVECGIEPKLITVNI